MPTRGENANHFDPEVVVLRGKGTNIKNQQKRDGKTETKEKYDSTKSHEMRKLEENEIGKITKINSKVYQAIIKGRAAKGWNRKQLASQIAVKPQIIDEVETGKAKYDIKLIQKLERKLGIKLTGAEFK
jgi:ribosome-binding protein aMBF1 (putative translation factor)